ncbi:MAG TPA: hypothetical protein VHU87_14000 [Rhizomicrobium sp.]|jgi:hypothetical protein|nr:hypothetical protein [Rhizomicrobium sp.]
MTDAKAAGNIPSDAEEIGRFWRFQDVLGTEHANINLRRAQHRRSPIAPAPMGREPGGKPLRPMYDTTGVCLSGGGIRSAAFCLGALQSLATRDLIGNIDYLSTVSGGGYIGASVSGCMSGAPEAGKTTTDFPFAAPGAFEDPPAVGHLRDYSNYILPRGHNSFVEAIAVILRGMATNLIFILTATLFLAGLTVFAYPDQDSLSGGSFLPQLFHIQKFLAGHVPLLDGAFTFTLWLLAILGAGLVGWAIFRSRFPSRGSDVRGRGVRTARWLIVALALCAFLDVQPLVIRAVLSAGGLPNAAKAAYEWLALVSAPLAAAVAFFSDRLAGFLKTAASRPGTGAMLKRAAAFAAVWLAALVLPFFLWAFYIWLSAAGIALNAAGGAPMPAAGIYFIGWFALWLITMLFTPNANSLHQFYRDKLSKAFLFDPLWREPLEAHHALRDSDSGDLVPQDKKKLHDISPAHGGPYHLINAALNLQGSIAGNRRGRNADFFLFSAEHIGSDLTGYVKTTDLETEDPHIDLAAAMAISGAAVSSDMGSSSIAPLAPTLALLNFRLGYWMKNPRFVNKATNGWKKTLSGMFKTYILSEMFGLLDESDPRVYLTDGGHIENLGLYALLNRHCKVIVAVDGEADPAMTFPALSTVQRYARIDLGIRIDVPWYDIAAVSLAATRAAEDGTPIPEKNGPHCAIGLIHYPDGQKGLLLYVKASVTGDEADYVLNYKQRNPAFPHESTGDQFFTEEQFECYRALGFHALDGFLTGQQDFRSNAELGSADDARKSFWAAMGKPAPEI